MKKKISNVCLIFYLIYCYIIGNILAVIGNMMNNNKLNEYKVYAIAYSIILIILNISLCVLFRINNNPRKLLLVSVLNFTALFPYFITLVEGLILLLPLSAFNYSPTVTLTSLFIGPYMLIDIYDSGNSYIFIETAAAGVLLVISLALYISLMIQRKKARQETVPCSAEEKADDNTPLSEEE